MKTTRKRCKHCGIEYSYQLSGNGDYEYNDEYYCHDCKKVMMDALKSVPKKFTYGWKEIPFNFSDRMKDVRQKTLSFLEECKKKNMPVIRKVYPTCFNSKISKAEYYVIDNIIYLVRYFYNGEKKMFMLCEKDINNGQYGKYWAVNEADSYDVDTNFHRKQFIMASPNMTEALNFDYPQSSPRNEG